MTSILIGIAAGAGKRLPSYRLPPPLILFPTALALAFVIPSGYFGGGGDDWHYLAAAECWRSNGSWLTSDACLPGNHWQARWPLVAPMALAIGLFGESHTSVQLVPFLYACAAILLFTHLANRLFGAFAAVAGGLGLLFTPAFLLPMLQPNVDMVELAFVLAFAAAGWKSLETGRGIWALAAGVALALAVHTRETSFVLLGIVALGCLFLPAERRRLALAGGVGFTVPALLEAAFFALRTGNPAHRINLALHHTNIPSTELALSHASSGLPIFNPTIIGGWRPAAGIDVHWTVNGPLNLLFHPHIGLTLLAIIVLALVCGRLAFADTLVKRRASVLSLCAGGMAFLLIYALAIDPKPRMFFVPLAAAVAVGGALAAAAWRSGRRALPLALALLIPGKTLLILLASIRLGDAEAVAARWIAAHPGEITMSESTRRNLALLPASREVPVDHPAKPLRLEIGRGACWESRSSSGAWQVVDGYDLRDSAPRFISRLRRYEIIDKGPEASLCLFRKR